MISLPPWRGELNHPSILNFVNLSSNHPLSGKINPSITDLKRLSHLDLSNNDFEGAPIPKFIGSLHMLYHLDLSYGKFTGMVPNHLGNLSNLHYLDITSYPSSYPLQVSDFSWFFALSSLQYLSLANLIFTTSPHELFRAMNKMSSLIVLDLSYCRLTSLPSSSPFLNVTSLSVLDLSENRFNSSLPSWLFNMSSLTKLDLSSSSLRGFLPSMLGRWKLCKLQDLLLSYSDITDDIADMLEAMSCSNQSLKILDLGYNELTGKLPNSLRQFTSLIDLDLRGNSVNSHTGVSGPIPTSIGNLSNLLSLNLKGNKMNGTIPESIGQLTNLYSLNLLENYWEGSIPKELCCLPSLHLLDLAENNLSGTIPTCLGDLDGFKLPQSEFTNSDYYLFEIEGYVRYTKHTELVINGRIVEYLKQMQVHSVIDLSKNNLSGEIPVNITQLIHLGALNLSWNHLTGNIPNNIGLLKDLENLDLSHNNLSGPIPTSMASMTFLSHLNLSHNNLSGQIPRGNQFGTFNEPSIYEGNPGLCGEPLPTNCSSLLHRKREHEDDGDGDDEKIERLKLYASIAAGYITGFWIVCGSLMLKMSWRHAYFNFLYNMRDKLLVFMIKSGLWVNPRIPEMIVMPELENLSKTYGKFWCTWQVDRAIE
ncbi:LRR receptor-like kinase resistance protein, partial [Trifolium pratense]